MHPIIHTTNHHHILHDQDAFTIMALDWFDVGYWRQQHGLVAEAQGRGTAWMVRHGDDEFVLRHYHRGGMVASLLQDRYLWRGLERTRAWREWRLLASLHEQGLPVPIPVAAHVVHTGIFYRADLITRRIEGAVSLFQYVSLCPVSTATLFWQRVGQCIRRFHLRGIYHADLNAHNILLDEAGKVYLIDFDRGEQRAAGCWEQANLKRLQRSLEKLKCSYPDMLYSENSWDSLLQGYHEGDYEGNHEGQHKSGHDLPLE
jgi:3-deoxy-D-manno-octulosonic acid kinase